MAACIPVGHPFVSTTNLPFSSCRSPHSTCNVNGASSSADKKIAKGACLPHNRYLDLEGCTTTTKKAEFQRRVFLLLAILGAPNSSAMAAGSRKVRLKDVENPRLQEALRAAVAGDLEYAEMLLTQLIQEAPESASLWSNRGSVRISMKQYELAVEDLSLAIQLAPEAPVPLLNRAIAYEALERYNEAIDDCKSAISRDPDEFAAWYNLGNVDVRVRDFNSALTAYEKAADLAPGIAGYRLKQALVLFQEFAAWYNLGNVDVRVRDFNSALTAYEKAGDLAPGIAGYRLKQALVLFQLHRVEEARKLLRGLVRKYPNYAEAHAALAAVLWSQGDRSNAEEQFSEATFREPMYHDIMWVNKELQWPPSMVQAMQNFILIS